MSRNGQKEGFRIIFVHSSSKQKDDEARKAKENRQGHCAIRGTVTEIKRLSSQDQKGDQGRRRQICKDVKGFVDVKVLTERKQVKVKVSPAGLP